MLFVEGWVGVSALCPCCSGVAFTQCCEPVLDGVAPSSPEALMRSRYTAYVRGDDDHLFRSWHPRTRPSPPYSRPVCAVGVVGNCVASAPVGDRATVEFVAVFEDSAGRRGQMRELSRFERRRGRWVYVDGLV